MEADYQGPGTQDSTGWAVWPAATWLVLLMAVELGGWDRALFHLFNGLPSITGPAFWAHATILGDGLVCAVLLLPWIRRHPERIWGGLLGAILMVLILRSFKSFLSLPRPLGVLPEDLVTVIGPGHRRSAFPSGHSATIALFAGVWALTASRRVMAWGALALAVLVGISRVAVGVHWPTDVLGGLALGWVAAWLGLRWASRWPWGIRRTGRLVLGGALLASGMVLLVIDHTEVQGILLFQRTLALICLLLGAAGWMEIRRRGAVGRRGPEG